MSIIKMNVFKKIAPLTLILSTFLISPIVMAKPATSASVDELLRLSELEQLLHISLQELNPYFEQESEKLVKEIIGSDHLDTQQLIISQRLTQTLYNTTEELLKQPAVIQKIKEIVKDTYTEEELRAYNAFLKTPEGRSINQKSTKVMSQLQIYMEQLVTDNLKNSDFEEKIVKVIAPLIEEQ